MPEAKPIQTPGLDSILDMFIPRRHWLDHAREDALKEREKKAKAIEQAEHAALPVVAAAPGHKLLKWAIRNMFDGDAATTATTPQVVIDETHDIVAWRVYSTGACEPITLSWSKCPQSCAIETPDGRIVYQGDLYASRAEWEQAELLRSELEDVRLQYADCGWHESHE